MATDLLLHNMATTLSSGLVTGTDMPADDTVLYACAAHHLGVVAAIRPGDDQGEALLIPILNRYKSSGTTMHVNCGTVRQCLETTENDVNLVAVHSGWEIRAGQQLEASPIVDDCARNDGLSLVITYGFERVEHVNEPDLFVRLTIGLTVMLEIEGEETEQDLTKYESAHRWITAVNNCEQMGRWVFAVNRAPQILESQLATLASG